ncbi:MAG: DDE-type integrase/transposase/recombinase [Dehalococcoidales bacterium]|nr:DDE-type integrase/transposase/recombinase [Dehalococcoidales bacterium]
MINIISKVTCKNCGSDAVVKFGSYKGLQYYFCKSCKRKFKADDSLFHMKVPPEYVSSALAMYYSGSSIDDIRDFLKQEYDYYPSKHVVFEWVDKYTALAGKQFHDVRPKVGDTWIADETVLELDKGVKVWFWDIIDADTRFLIASRASLTRGTLDAKALMEAAYKKAGKAPKEVITDHLAAYLDGVEMTFGSDTEHIQGGPFKLKPSGESTSQIERFHGTIKERTKVMRAFRDMDTLIRFMDGYLVYYNYFKPNDALEGKTPAEAAKVDYQPKNWKELTQLPVPKEAEIKTHKVIRLVASPTVSLETPRLKLPTLKVPKSKRMPTERLGRDVLISNVGGARGYSRRRIKGAKVIGRIRGGRR